MCYFCCCYSFFALSCIFFQIPFKIDPYSLFHLRCRIFYQKDFIPLSSCCSVFDSFLVLFSFSFLSFCFYLLLIFQGTFPSILIFLFQFFLALLKPLRIFQFHTYVLVEDSYRFHKSFQFFISFGPRFFISSIYIKELIFFLKRFCEYRTSLHFLGYIFVVLSVCRT